MLGIEILDPSDIAADSCVIYDVPFADEYGFAELLIGDDRIAHQQDLAHPFLLDHGDDDGYALLRLLHTHGDFVEVAEFLDLGYCERSHLCSERRTDLEDIGNLLDDGLR